MPPSQNIFSSNYIPVADIELVLSSFVSSMRLLHFGFLALVKSLAHGQDIANRCDPI